jgi:hypothetical protein
MENLHTVSNVFSDRIFHVPDYQRGYAWEEKQCQDFVEDLELLGPSTNHFMGLLILHAHTESADQVLDHHGKAYKVFDVIDGQQRLTTLVLYLDALHDEMQEFDSLKTMAEGIQQTYIELRDLNDQRLPKLRLNRDTHTFFCDSVLAQGQSIEPPRIRSHELLLAARDFFRAYLAEKRRENHAGYAEWLKAEFLKVAQWEIVARKEDTIEHVLPQAWDTGGYWAARFSPEEHERWLHDIGNLTLTYDNSALGNKPFPEKKGTGGQPCCYASSTLFIEQALARDEDWTPETIQARRQKILDWAAQRWEVVPIEYSAKDPEDEAELARRAVTRIFIPRGQMLLYKVLYAAGPEGMPFHELHERIGVTKAQLLGVLGALGNRINQTEGLKNSQPGTSFLLRWNTVDGAERYAMQPRLVEVLEGIPALREILRTWSVQEIDGRFRTVWEKDWDSQRTDLDLPG